LKRESISTKYYKIGKRIPFSVAVNTHFLINVTMQPF